MFWSLWYLVISIRCPVQFWDIEWNRNPPAFEFSSRTNRTNYSKLIFLYPDFCLQLYLEIYWTSHFRGPYTEREVQEWYREKWFENSFPFYVSLWTRKIGTLSQLYFNKQSKQYFSSWKMMKFRITKLRFTPWVRNIEFKSLDQFCTLSIWYLSSGSPFTEWTRLSFQADWTGIK